MTQQDNDLNYDWFWFLTWTTYGTFLPGDIRGATGLLHDESGTVIEHNQPGQDHIPHSVALAKWSKLQMKGDAIRLNLEQARVLLTQFHCTASFRRWRLLGVAIMDNHIHVGVNVHSDPDPETILRDFKSYGSRALNLQWGKPESDSRWTESGSKRKLDSDNSVIASIRYIINQQSPLLVWTLEDGMIIPVNRLPGS